GQRSSRDCTFWAEQLLTAPAEPGSSGSPAPSSRALLAPWERAGWQEGSLPPAASNRPRRPPAGIWSPAGGFFADPKKWKRNTVLAVA
ncbi:MAG: hypothetical protein J0M00_27360, partial [Burkholderiales bacterium]|nr:hypothetical protein [Burkholderiales bacterium]